MQEGTYEKTLIKPDSVPVLFTLSYGYLKLRKQYSRIDKNLREIRENSSMKVNE